ncbi:MAG: DUF4129 domain-containing protein [Bacteroidales bacterium]|nr:DUF4129 domain-containing protein [Bacteroidales bacterium]
MATHLSHDTIVCDTTRLQEFINSGNYNYNSELDSSERPSLLGKAIDAFKSWLDKTMNDIMNGVDQTLFSSNIMKYVWIALAIILLLVIIYVMYKKRIFIFKPKASSTGDYEVVEDNIYGIDFEDEIERALATGNFKEAVRLRYLHCLRILSDTQAIVWMPHKTPLQYTQEFNHNDFKQLTRRYVLVRYGDYEATRNTYDTITQLSKNVESFLNDNQPTTEGGDEP